MQIYLKSRLILTHISLSWYLVFDVFCHFLNKKILKFLVANLSSHTSQIPALVLL